MRKRAELLKRVSQGGGGSMSVLMGTEHVVTATNGSSPAKVDMSDSGILLFALSNKLIYMDAQARQLSARINLSQSGCLANGILPPSVTMLVAEIVNAIEAKLETNNFTPFEIRRLISKMKRPVLLRGYGLPGEGGMQEGSVLVLMEDFIPYKEFCSKQAAKRFHLTEREVAVVKNLSKGHTNKEIACALTITEQTVKEVMKRIMRKTMTTTRTGILVEILGL